MQKFKQLILLFCLVCITSVAFAAEPVPQNMEKWFEESNRLVNTAGSRLYDMVDSPDWGDMYLVAVPTEKATNLRFYYVMNDGTAYSGQRLDNPGIQVDGYIQRVVDLEQPVRDLYNHFGEANMPKPSSIWIKVTSEGKIDIKYNYDEDVKDTNAYFEDIETTMFNGLVR